MVFTKKDVEEHFKKHGAGEITEVKLMSGFGFIEYKDSLDAMDVVPGMIPHSIPARETISSAKLTTSSIAFHGSDFMGERLTVQFARGPRHRDAFTNPDRSIPRPRRTPHRMQITGLPSDTSWQVRYLLLIWTLDHFLWGIYPWELQKGYRDTLDLKDFARQSNLDVVYSEIGRDRDGKGFVEFETAPDLRTAVEKLDHLEFKGSRVTCVADSALVNGAALDPLPPHVVVVLLLLLQTMIVVTLGVILLPVVTTTASALPAVTTMIPVTLEIGTDLPFAPVALPTMDIPLLAADIRTTRTIGLPDADLTSNIHLQTGTVVTTAQ
ncbi:hypothetical protein FGG08_007470 [Glutinoglossum americanum]|uniref:RRM domain-containing protein n=1 Tax=Glutinoglossum americanum TaxID=1670608 RepID=A0A9P8KTV9_9PEZI|nr:hypothetical protein FGG08_007470 [Glutinoglossum americanum]